MPGVRTELIHNLILDYLEKQESPVSSKELAEHLKVNQYTVTRAMRTLTKQQRVRRRPGPGNSYLYKFVSRTPKVTRNSSNLSSPPLPVDRVKDYDPVPSNNLQTIVSSWLSNGWSPKSTEAAKTLVETLSTIYQLQWLEVARGQPVDQSDLDHLKVTLIGAKRLADSFAEFFGRLLATEQLWDSKRTTAYTLSDIEDPQAYLESARNVSTVLQ